MPRSCRRAGGASRRATVADVPDGPRSPNTTHHCDESPEIDGFRRSRAGGAGPGDAELARIAGNRHGLVSTRELLGAVGEGGLDHRIVCRRVHRQHRGVYLLGHRVLPDLAKEAAALLAVGADARVSHRSAGAMLDLHPYAGATVHVTVAGRRPRSRHGIRVHWTGGWDPGDVLVLGGLPVTSPTRTLLDLAGVLDVDALERAGERAQIRGLYDREALLAALARSPRMRGARRLREALLLDEDPVFLRSRAERLMLRLVKSAGLPRPEVNVRVAGAERDFVWREQRLIVEVDGWQFHGSRAAFERDRRRDATAVAAGFRVMRVTWRRMRGERPALLGDLIRALAIR